MAESCPIAETQELPLTPCPKSSEAAFRETAFRIRKRGLLEKGLLKNAHFREILEIREVVENKGECDHFLASRELRDSEIPEILPAKNTFL